MNIGKSIRRIREENNMSQEAFGQIFFVTRQTVSNWENEKSYPDLNTLVKISDIFNVSLDTLLKEDPEMVNTISENFTSGLKWNKIRRTVFILISTLITLTLLSALVYVAVWHSRKNKLESHFNNAVSSLGFVQSDERYYILSTDNGIRYELPHQEMPSVFELSTDFHAKHLYGKFETALYAFTVIISDMNMYSLQISDKTDTENDLFISLDENGEIRSPEKLSSAESEIYNENSEKIKDIIRQGKEIYAQVYI